MKKLLISFFILSFTSSIIGQTIHQVCVSEVSNAPCSSNSGVFTPSSLTIAIGDKIQFTTYMMGISGYDGTSHQIKFNGGSPQDVTLPVSANILSQTTTVTTPAFTTAGTFTMECVNSSHCFNFADILEGWSCTAYSVTVGTPTGVSEKKIKDLITVYPNPSNGIINIDLSAIQNDNPTIYLLDMLGKKIKIQPSLNSSTSTIDISSYKKGVYFVKVVSDNYSFNYPIFLQ